jgi:hypothetical protein
MPLSLGWGEGLVWSVTEMLSRYLSYGPQANYLARLLFNCPTLFSSHAFLILNFPLALVTNLQGF